MSYNLPTITPMRMDTEKELRRQIPRLQTAPDTKRSDPSAMMNAQPPATASTPNDSSAAPSPSPSSGSHHRFVLTDHVAFRYLEEDPSVQVLARRIKLEGYEIYLVEQWACSRMHPTFIITTYTGDPKDTCWASIIGVPANESTWSPQLRIYFKALSKYHARRKETSLGTLMITNLSSFPSSLTVIPVPDGDVKKHRELFLVNENLKRLGCSGRLGIKLAPPSSATQAKFHQLYRTSDKIPLNSSVIELVKLCQVALVMFGKLEPEYADGLLCDVTEKAVNDWWVEFGAEYYSMEPQDGILGPTTVAALLGMLMGARNRLSAYNAPIAKDVFDVESTKRAIAYFQKSLRIQKTRRLDRQTLERLRRATAKAASKEGWGMQRALKSTVAELGGKGGEMVMGMVGAGDKAGIADIETVDIERFIELVHGERAKWLWYGKPRKTTTDMFSRLPGEDVAASPEEQRNATTRLLKREPAVEDAKLLKRETETDDKKKWEFAEGEKDQYSKRAVIKRATEKIESGSGLSRIKDAMKRQNQQSKYREEVASNRMSFQQTRSDLAKEFDTTTPMAPRRNFTDNGPSYTKGLMETPHDSASTLGVDATSQRKDDEQQKTSETASPTAPDDADRLKQPAVEDPIVEDVNKMVSEDRLPYEPVDMAPVLLRRTQSAEHLGLYHAEHRNENWWPRHLSFSIAEESVLILPTLTAVTADEEEQSDNPRAQLAAFELVSEDAKRLRHRLAWLSTIDAQWTEASVRGISDLDAQAEADIQELEGVYYPRLETYQQLREDAHEIVSRKRLQLQESIRDLETLGAKLEYEINSLRSKVDDVDDGVSELERQVEFVEDRVRELEGVLEEREGWVHWGVRVLTGIGRPPEK
jgi:hypothetical protein